MKELQTTPEMCQHELAGYSQMERSMTADAWIAMDALAAHELLALVQRAAEYVPEHQGLLRSLISEWVTP